ncbi:MAG TPA: hypothetical protein PLG60_03900 [Acidimicrobiales bacterium]|nr:hypothetical protein [Acidimicrobiales bacterium]
MSPRHAHRYWSWRFASSKVPEVTAQFWYLKLLSTGMGEATSDYFVHRFNPEVAVLVAAAVFAGALYAQLKSPRYETLTYWFAVVMVSVFGTMCADVVHVGLGVPYAVSSVVFALALAAVFFTWRRLEGTLSIHSITTSRRELFYWLSVTTTFALGTAVGDETAATLGLGYLKSALVFLALFVAVALAFAIRRRQPIASFWCTYVLTRPLGASFADWLGRPVALGGKAWGPGTVSLLSSAVIVVSLAILAYYERRKSAPAPLT